MSAPAKSAAAVVPRALLALLAFGSIARAADGGAPLSPPSVGAEAAVSPLVYGSADVSVFISGACGSDRCLVVWDGYNYPYAMMIDSDGSPLRRAALALDGLAWQQAVTFVGGDFVVATSSGSDITLVRVAPDGSAAATNTVTLGTAISGVAVAWNGTHLLLAYQDAVGSDNDTYTVRFDATTLSSLEAPRLLQTHSGASSVVANGSEFVVFAGQSSLQAWAIADSGQPRVGPVSMPVELSVSLQSVSANGTVVLLSGQGNLFRLGSDLQVSASNYAGSGSGSGLGWNGTSLLVAQGSSSNAVSTMRFSLSLGAQDPIYNATPLTGRPVVLGRGSEFMLLGWNTGYTPDDYGIYSIPLNSGGRPRLTTGTLVSVLALQQYNPLVVAQPSGFVVAAGQGRFQMAILPVGADGRQVPGRVAGALTTYTLPRPIALGAGANGGILFSGATLDPRILEARFDALGQSLDTYPTEYAASTTQTRGSLVWNGVRYLWLFGDGTRAVAADGTVSMTPMRIYDPSTIFQSTADAIGTTTLVAVADAYQPSGASGLQLRVMRLDQTGAAIDSAPADVGPLYARIGDGIALGHDAAHYLVAWDACSTESNGAVTSEMRAALVGSDGKPAAAGSVLLRRVTGDPPPGPYNVAIHALTNPAVVFDGNIYWVAWRERGVWVRRVTTDGQIADAQPIKLNDDPVTGFAVASRGDGSFLLVYDKLDLSPDAQSPRLEARMVTSGGGGGMGGAGGGGGGGGGAGGASGSGGSGGSGGPGGRGGAAGTGGAGGRGGAGGASGAGGAGGRGGAGGLGGGAGISGAGGATGGASGAAASGGAGASGGVGGGAGAGAGASGGAGAGGGAGASGGGGSAAFDGAAGSSAADGGGRDQGSAADAGSGGASSGCSCAVAAPTGSGAGAWLVVALALAARRRRRRAACRSVLRCDR